MSRLKGTLIDAQAYNRGRDGQSPQIDLSLGVSTVISQILRLTRPIRVTPPQLDSHSG